MSLEVTWPPSWTLPSSSPWMTFQLKGREMVEMTLFHTGAKNPRKSDISLMEVWNKILCLSPSFTGLVHTWAKIAIFFSSLWYVNPPAVFADKVVYGVRPANLGGINPYMISYFSYCCSSRHGPRWPPGCFSSSRSPPLGIPLLKLRHFFYSFQLERRLRWPLWCLPKV